MVARLVAEELLVRHLVGLGMLTCIWRDEVGKKSAVGSLSRDRNPKITQEAVPLFLSIPSHLLLFYQALPRVSLVMGKVFSKERPCLKKVKI